MLILIISQSLITPFTALAEVTSSSSAEVVVASPSPIPEATPIASNTPQLDEVQAVAEPLPSPTSSESATAVPTTLPTATPTSDFSEAVENTFPFIEKVLQPVNQLFQSGSNLISNVTKPHASLKKDTLQSTESIELALQRFDQAKTRIVVKNQLGEVLNVAIHWERNTVEILPPASLKAGKYSVEFFVDEELVQTLNFSWGVLALNTHKSIYQPGETAEVAIAVLNERGQMVCDAEVTLLIRTPDWKTHTLSTSDQSIIVSDTCDSTKGDLEPDYMTSFEVGNRTGTISLELTASTENGINTITHQIEIQHNPLFDIARNSATRIYPLNQYPMTMTIVPREDFHGYVIETVPKNFTITSTEHREVYSTTPDLYIGDSASQQQFQSITDSPISITEDSQMQYIVWQVNWVAGKTYQLHYSYDPPDISPYLFHTGPLQFFTELPMTLIQNDQGSISLRDDFISLLSESESAYFFEARSWQIASDAITKIRQEINILNSTMTGTNTVLSSNEIVNLDSTAYAGTPTYYFEVIASATSGSTGNIRLRQSGTTTDDATIALSGVGTSFGRYRSTAFTAQGTATDYFVYVDDAGASKSVNIQAARIIIIQSVDPLSKTQAQIEIGNAETGKSNTVDAALNNPKYWKYESANWDPAPEFFFEATIKKNLPSGTMPNYQAAGTTVSGTGAVSPAWPTHQAGDIGIMVVETSGNQAINTVPSGWAHIPGSPVNDVNSTAGSRLSILWKRASSSTETTLSIGDSGDHQVARIFTFRNVISSGDPWDVIATDSTPFATTTVSVPSVTTTMNNTLIVLIASRPNDSSSTTQFSAWTNANLSSLTERGESGTTGGNGGGFVLATGGKASAGSTGTTNANSAAATTNAAMTVALKPNIDTSASISVKLQQDDGSFGTWTDVTNGTISETGSIATPMRFRTTTAFTPVNSRHYRIVSSTSNSATGYDIYNAKIIANQLNPDDFSSQTTTNFQITSGGYNVQAMTEDDNYVYSGTGNTPANVVRLAKSDFSTSTTKVLASGENYAVSMIDDNNYVYVGTDTAPARIVRITKSDFNTTTTKSLAIGENYAYSMTQDDNYIYIGTGNAPAKIVRLSKSDFTTTTTKTLSSGENFAYSLLQDSNYVYIGLYGTPGRVMRLSKSDFTTTATKTLSTGENNVLAMTQDDTYIYALTLTSPPNVVRILKSDFSTSTTKTLTGETSSRTIEQDENYLYIGTGASPAKVIRLSKSDFNTTVAKTLDTGLNVIRGFASDSSNIYAGTYTNPAYLVKVPKTPLTLNLTELQYTLANTGSIGASTGLKDVDTYWDPDEWSGVLNSYVHEAYGVSGGTADVKLQSSPNGTPVDVSGSTITDAVQLERSASLTMPATATDLDVNVTGTGTLNGSKIIVQSEIGGVATITVSGNAYGSDKATAYTGCDGSTTNIHMSIDSTTYTTFCNIGTGAYSFTGITPPASGTPIFIWINDLSNRGSTVVRYDGSGNSEYNWIYVGYATVTSDDTNPVTNTLMDALDYNSNQYLLHSVTSGNLTVGSGHFYVMLKFGVASGSMVYDPGGSITTGVPTRDFEIGPGAMAEVDTTSYVGRDLIINNAATLNINADIQIIGGDITTSGTNATVTYTSGTPTVSLTGAGSIGGGTTPTLNFYNLTVNHSGTTTLTSSPLAVNNTLTVSNGTLSLGSNNLNMGNTSITDSGSIKVASTKTLSQSASGTTTILSSSSGFQCIGSTGSLCSGTQGNITFGTVVIGNGSTNFESEVSDPSGTVNILGDLNLTSSSTFSPLGTINIAGDLVGNGILNPNNSTVAFTGTGTSTVIQGKSFYNLSATTPGKTVQFGSGTTQLVNGVFTVTGDSGTPSLIQSNSSGNQWYIDLEGTSNVSYVSVKDSGCDPTSGTITVSNGTSVSNNGTCWNFGGANTAPSSPASLNQTTTTDVSIPTGNWTNENSVKFTATGSDANNPDTLYLCIEIDPIGQAFSNTEDSCGSGVSYSGSPVSLSHTISGLVDGTLYHWQARLKDQADAYSSWVSYGANLESVADVGIDMSPPTGGTVYDGTSAGVDAEFNSGSLSELSANWANFNSNASGLNKYQYAVGTTVGGTQVVNWTDNGTNTSVTVSSLTLQTGQIYYFSVRAVDTAGNTQSPAISSDGQIVNPSLQFAFAPTTLSFANLSSTNSFTDTQVTTLTTSTNAYNGYVIRSYASQLLQSPQSNTIPMFSAGSYTSPANWGVNDVGFGYTSNDTTIQGNNKFGGGTLYAPVSLSNPGDIVADHTSLVTGSPISNQQFTLTYKLQTTSTQAAGSYSSNIMYTVTPMY